LQQGDIIVSIGELGTPGDCDTVEKPIVIPIQQGITEKDVPVNICNVGGREIVTAQIDIRYVSAVVSIIDQSLGSDVPSGWEITGSDEIEDGLYRIIARAMGVGDPMPDGELLKVRFKAVSSDPSDKSNISIEEALLETLLGERHPVALGDNEIYLPVELSAFGAFWHPDGVRIFWQAESQRDNLGWNIYRSESKDGTFVKINGTLIKGAGTTSVPMKYSFIDKDAQKGKTYYYYLEDVSYNGEKHQTPPVKSTPLRLSTSWGAIKLSVLK
jgi:hypothetical protein